MVCWIADCGLELLSDPFRCCQMQSFVQDEHFLDGLRDELRDLICYEKNNDLYKFHQVDVTAVIWIVLCITCPLHARVVKCMQINQHCF